MKSKIIFDPPDPYLTDLAARINKKLRAGRVSFFTLGGDHSAIFQHSSRRAVIRLGGRPSDVDIDAMVQAIESWAGFQVDGSPYSTEIPPLPDSGW